ncbi:GNAT family N-acetyltransferase [Amycolatopsis rhizosphaerae]|uniref:GNAT family N-acetyltransferase n=1 Tax=Amycolatopsis rhizosphaerae TaxID=2053003 RepID=A0A558BIS0_9PSEU|nr:GNAT family N-acetyltransferase [Amycolatopsis rhizosphaerae]TVT36408.1 GNAT family N-acetyltransferase [Amycolatopsis rhizosphaerae]
MDPIETLERQCADAWPPVAEDKVGDWRLRAAGGFTGRANSALAIGDPGIGVPEALDRVCDFAHVHAVPPMVLVVEGSRTERAIEAAGWVPHVQHAKGYLVSVLVSPLTAGAAPARDDVTIRSAPTPAWWELAAGTAEPGSAQRHVLTTGEIGYGEAAGGAGAVRAAVVEDLLHVSCLAVRPEHRRRGLAKALLAASGMWAAGHGATRCALQVSVDNAPALALYAALGFREHHRYRYWIPAWKDRSL